MMRGWRLETLESKVRRLVNKGDMDHELLGGYMMSAVGNILTRGMQSMRTTSLAEGEEKGGELSVPMTHGHDLEKEARELEVLDDHQDEVAGLCQEHGPVLVTVTEIPHLPDDQMYLNEADDFGSTSSPLILEQVTEQNAVYPKLNSVGIGSEVGQFEEGIRCQYYEKDYDLVKTRSSRGEDGVQPEGDQDECEYC
jgi:hypothetical protein